MLLGVLAAGAAMFAGSYFVSRQICLKQMGNPVDNLQWLRQEFHLNDAEMARVRELHEGYIPKCAEICVRIAAKRSELEDALGNSTNVSAAAEQKMIELADLRAHCQAEMLRHFVEVSQAMPPEEGKRYLEEMKRLTLGFHEQIEQAMSDHTGHVHGNN